MEQVPPAENFNAVGVISRASKQAVRQRKGNSIPAGLFIIQESGMQDKIIGRDVIVLTPCGEDGR